MNSNFFRHPALWSAVAFVAGALVFQAGRANAQIPLLAPTPPAITSRQASYVTEGSPANLAPVTLKQLDQQFSDLVDRIGSSVVHIRTGEQQQGGMMTGAQGSGVIVRPDGWIVTNDHVVNGSKQVTVILANGKEYQGRVIESQDDNNDIAVVKIEAKNLPVAKFADSGKVRPGQYAIAVGAPFGLENTVTIGHISALSRENQAGSPMGEVRSYLGMIQTDAPINPGNSGGPLLNIDGEVIGINTSIATQNNAGIGFAIPSSQAAFVSDLLINNKTLKRGYLNIGLESLKPYELEEQHLAGGVRVAAVIPGGAAAKAGLKEKDIITKVGSYAVKNDQDLLNSMLRYAPGETVAVQVVRDGQTISKDVKIDAKLTQPVAQATPSQPPQGMDIPNFPDFNFEDWFGRNRDRAERQRAEEQPNRKVGEPARLGVQFTEVTSEARATYQLPAGTKGAVVVSVEAGSVASRLGLKSGDLITQLGDKAIEKGTDLVEAVKKFKVGDTTQITFTRYSGKNNVMQMSQTVAF